MQSFVEQEVSKLEARLEPHLAGIKKEVYEIFETAINKPSHQQQILTIDYDLRQVKQSLDDLQKRNIFDSQQSSFLTGRKVNTASESCRIHRRNL